MSRRVSVLVLLATLLISGLAPAAVAADNTALPLPDTIAAVGDSITQAASTGGSLGADYPNNSWSTGGNSNVNSHLLRLRAEGANPTATNLSVSGAKVVDLEAQMVLATPLKPDYLTVLIGGNDLCTDTVGQMTDATLFGDQFEAALDVLYAGSPATAIYVVSIPDAHQLWSLFKSSFWARFIWSSAQICQSLLANPTSNQQPDVVRRAEVRARNMAYNAEMAQVCATYEGTCLYDGGAAFNTPLAKSDVSGDYFHPSVAGQAKLSGVSWNAGYSWSVAPPANVAPSASFTFACTDLTCAFTDGSTDGDGTVVSRAWNFGDGTGSTATNPSHTYAAGTYTVNLTVTDDDGATGNTSKQVSVSATPTNNPPSASFTFSCSGLACSFTDGSSDVDGTIASRSWSFGDGATSTVTNPSHTYAAGGAYTVSLTVTDDDGAPGSTSQSVTVTSGTTTISLSVNAYKVKGSQMADLTWSGASSTSVDLYRNGVLVATTANDGAHTDAINGKGGGSYVYQLCEAGTTKCSGEVTASY